MKRDINPILSVKDLSVTFNSGSNYYQVVNGLSFNLFPCETLSLVGESGSGKSITALSILQLLPSSAKIGNGSIKFINEELIGKPESYMRSLRTRKIGIIFQEPMTSLNPLQSIEAQVGEVLEIHQGLSKQEIKPRVINLLEMVGFKRIKQRLHSLPHELSGGERQRVMIAMSLALEPEILIADEPTTALDATIQSQILSLLSDLKKRIGMSIIFITHDLSVVRSFADNICVLEKGKIVEHGSVDGIFSSPKNPYTKKLLLSQPVIKESNKDEIDTELLSVKDLKVWFPIKDGIIRRTVGYTKAVNNISFLINKNETLGVVGESGSGKTTLAFAILRLVESLGSIEFHGQNINNLSKKEMRKLRKKMQIVFQDPYGSLSPRMSVNQIIEEGLSFHLPSLGHKEKRDLIKSVLDDVGLNYKLGERFPHEFSGGQRQRISIARALVLKPEFLVLDEPTSALDVSIQAQIIDLLCQLQAKYKLSYLFISHDLRVIRSIADKILVMKNGFSIEQASSSEIFNNPQDSYTQSLVSSFK